MQKIVGKFFLAKGFFVDIDEYFQSMAIKAAIMQAKALSQKKLLV